MNDPLPTIADRKAWVLARVPIAELVEKHVKLSGLAGSPQRRGQCPFHHGKSASFSVKCPQAHEQGFAHCFGCGFHGNAIDFLAAIKGWEFIDALAELERQEGSPHARDASGAPVSRGPVQRERAPAPPARKRRFEQIDTLAMAQVLWRRARADLDKVRAYFTGRGVQAAMLTDARLGSFRYLPECPLMQWDLKDESSATRWPKDALVAPAVLAMVRSPQMLGEPAALAWVPVGLHVTYLDPSGTATMKRRKPWAGEDDEDPWFPKRKMFGPVGGGAVVLGTYRPDAHLWLGEGNETTLSGMEIGGAAPDDVGLATLSLDTLQGQPLKWRGGIWPLHAINPDPAKPCFRVPGHFGRVTGLVDSDMKPLKNQKVVERKGGPIIDRAITGPERADICGALFVKGWRLAGVADARALRAPLGMDFNDVVMAEGAGV